MLRLSLAATGDACVIASLRGPNQHYVSGTPSASSEVGYNWGTRTHAELNIRLHHEIVRTVAHQLRERFTIPVERTVLMGFSQPVGLNYRFIGTYPSEAGGVIGICAESRRIGRIRSITPSPHRSCISPGPRMSSSHPKFPAGFLRGCAITRRVWSPHAAGRAPLSLQSRAVIRPFLLKLLDS